jgi:Ca2+-binding EF-hand superfamily protein
MKKIILISFVILMSQSCSHTAKHTANSTTNNTAPRFDYNSVDADSSNTIDREEYEQLLLTYFDSLDKDRDGRVKVTSESNKGKFVSESDLNKDGHINIIEFNKKVDQSFKSADKDKNKLLSAREYHALGPLN